MKKMVIVHINTRATILWLLLMTKLMALAKEVTVEESRRNEEEKLEQLKTTGIGFNGKPSFKIAMFADLHFGENAWDDWGALQDVESSIVMSNVLDRELPDFVVYLGDLVTANNLPNPNAAQHWQQALAPTVTRNIPWASVFGNHDDAPFVWNSTWFGPSGSPILPAATGSLNYYQGTTRVDLMASDSSSQNSLSQAGPQGLWPSVSNFVIPIASSNAAGAAAIMYFLDSGGGSYPEVISASQVSWFEEVSLQHNPTASIPEIVFWHIPSIAYSAVGPQPLQPIVAPCVGNINYEAVAPQEAEWGIMNSLASRSSIKAVFVGHNHGLDWCCPSGSMHLCFARHTGYGGYGSWIRGTRIVELVESPVFQIKTWVTLEDGSVVSSLLL
jgi:hypothetical protein